MRTRSNRLIRFAAAGLLAVNTLGLLAGCAKPRPVRTVAANASRFQKTVFDGEFLFLKSLIEVGSPGVEHRDLFPGRFLADDSIIRFRYGRDLLEVVDQDPKFDASRGLERNPVLAVFPIRNVDVLRRQNVDGLDTNEEYEADDRNTWQNTKLIVVDFAGDRQDEYRPKTRATGVDDISLDGEVLNVTVRRHLEDGTTLKIRYSFLRYRPSTTYAIREYPEELQTRFGFFKTVLYGRDRFNQVTQTSRRELMNRVDTSKPFVFRFTPGFPEHLKAAAKRSVRMWGEALRDATGRTVLVEPIDSTGETLGDLRYNFIHYDDSPDATHKALGYAPTFVNPRTGEILKADVVLYGSTLLRAVHSERTYRRLLRDGVFDEPTEENRPQPSDYYLRELFMPQGGRESFRAPSLPSSDAEELMRLIRTEFTPELTMAQLRQEMTGADATHTTMLHGGIYGLLGNAMQADVTITDDKLIEDFFEQLMGHENGHPLGLRHNFMASADDRHYIEHGHTSSRMDYVWLSTTEPIGVGPYDRAALAVLYGEGSKRRDAEESREVFLFCTDDRPDTLFNARNPLCLPFDAGSTLSDAVDHHDRRYRASYVHNNARLNAVWFPPTDRDYLRRVVSYLLPQRLIYDHANAVLAAYSTGDYGRLWHLLRQRIEADGRSGEVIRTVTVSVGTDVTAAPGRANITYRTERRRLDMNRVEDAVRDAKDAKVKSFRALARLIVSPSTPSRPEPNTQEARFFDLQRRGVLPDKALALLLLGSRMIDPFGDGKRTTPFATMRYDVERAHTRIAWDLFADLISDQRSVYAGDGTFQGRVLQQYDLAMRELAAKLLVDEMAATPEGVDAMQMLAIERSPVDARSWRRKRELRGIIDQVSAALPAANALAAGEAAAILAGPAPAPAGVGGLLPALTFLGPHGLTAGHRAAALQTRLQQSEREWQELDRNTATSSRADERFLDSIDVLRPERVALAKSMREADPSDDVVRTAIQARIQDKALQRNRIGVAFAAESAGDRFLRAPCDVPGLPFVPGTCLLMRDNINLSEIAWLAIGVQMEGIDKQLDEARMRGATAGRIRELEGQRENFRGQREFVRLYIAGEIDFAQRLTRYYRREHR